MTNEAIIESGMSFGPFPAGQCFYVEKSQAYQCIQERVPMAEFLLLKTQRNQPVVWVVEAKSSSPRAESQPNFATFIDEIRQKLSNAFLLCVSLCLQRHGQQDDFPDEFKQLNLQQTAFKFVLVIRGHKDEWLQPLNDALQLSLTSLRKTWALPATSVAVLNDKMTKQLGLILS